MMLEQQPLVSVIVPVYNTAAYVGRCLDSLLAQSYGNIEIICVDDGSTDDSLKVLQQYAQRDTRVKVLHQKNAGVSAARNAGLQIARGEIIGFSDADDAYRGNALQQVRDMYESTSADIIVTGICYVYVSKNSSSVCYAESKECSARHLQLLMMYDSRIMGSVCNKFFKRKCLENLSFHENLTHCEDMHFVSQVLQRQPEMRVIISPIITYEYHVNTESATQNPARLLNLNNRLLYLDAMDVILSMYPKDWDMWLLVRANQFLLLRDHVQKFANCPEIQQSLARQALRYVPAWLLCHKRLNFYRRCRMVVRVLLVVLSFWRRSN